MVLSVDAERERISLGIKQLDKDPSPRSLPSTPRAAVQGTVLEVDAKGAVVELMGGVEGHVRASELARDRVEDARTVLKAGDEIEAKFVGLDRKRRAVSLS